MCWNRLGLRLGALAVVCLLGAFPRQGGAASPSPSPSSMFNYDRQTSFLFAPTVLSSAAPKLYLGEGISRPSASIASVPAPCVLSSSAAGTGRSSLDLTSPISDSRRRDVRSCTQLFPVPVSSSSPDQVLRRSIAQTLSCFYQGRVVDVSSEVDVRSSNRCSSGLSTGFREGTPRVVCNLADGEGTLSVNVTGSTSSFSATPNHLSQPCVASSPDPNPDPQNSVEWKLWYLSSWLNSQIPGIWVQTSKYALDQVVTDLTSPTHQISIRASECQALAQDYVSLLAFSKKISDSINTSVSSDLPDPGTWDRNYCSPVGSPSPGASPDVNSALPVSALCYLRLANQHLVHLYLKIAQCEVTGRADDAMANFQARIQSILGPLQTALEPAYTQSVQDGVNMSQDGICKTETTDRCVGRLDIRACAQPLLEQKSGEYAASQFVVRMNALLPGIVSDLQRAVLGASFSGTFWPNTRSDYP